jgi:hypothetical protein
MTPIDTLRQAVGMKQLPLLPIDFDEEAHSYRWQPTGERMMLSVTKVLAASKDPKVLRTFERTKSTWAPRGTYVHAALEQFLKGRPAEELIGKKYNEYVQPLLEYPMWQNFEPIALEYRVCDLRRNIGGSLDVLGYDHLMDRMVLLDLKTLGKSGKPYSTDAQLGGYLSMLIDHHKLVVDECLTMWSESGEAHLGECQPPTRCLEAWEDAYDLWAMKQEVL